MMDIETNPNKTSIPSTEGKRVLRVGGKEQRQVQENLWSCTVTLSNIFEFE